MALTEEAQNILAVTVERWFKNFTGMSALDAAESLSLDHAATMRQFEDLAANGYGSLKQDVQLFQVSFDLEDRSAGFKYEPVTTHIFFPSKEVLRQSFYSSDQPQQQLPEYTVRLHLGASQVGLAFFHEEVLAKYMNHPEHYRINDSLSGGEVSAATGLLEDRFLYVRYGKCRLMSGNIAVTAIYKDLSDMSELEQRHWHSHELDEATTDLSDDHFKKFLARTYEGSWDEFEDPVTRLLQAVSRVNEAFEPSALFRKTENAYIRLPTERTYKSYCDAASELYKIVGPDNLSQPALKAVLTNAFDVPASSLKNTKSGRPFSSLQLFSALEKELGEPGLFTDPLRIVADLRIAADHKVLEADSATRSYSRDFAELCDTLAQALEKLASLRRALAK